MDVSKIDKNFLVSATVDRPGLEWKDAESCPFQIYGVYREGECFRRLPESVAQQVSAGVLALHANTSGGRLRFKSDSPYIAIHAEMSGVCQMPHFSDTGNFGFDLYTGSRHLGSYVPLNAENGFESVVDILAPSEKTYTIHFPLYANIKKLYIGIQKGSSLSVAEDYAIEKPVVYYGSSITQGGCASRPGNAYTNMLSAQLNCNHINLGFSGSAKGERPIAEYIAGLSMSAFVFDYDYNAPSVEHLQKTHNEMFQIIRRAHPDLPVLMLTRPRYYVTAEDKERESVVRATYQMAHDSGDQNVYMISGRDLLTSWAMDVGLVDYSHPNDLGFASMAQAIAPVLREMLVLK